MTHFDASEYKASLAAEVKDFNAKDYMDPRSARRMELFSQYAIAAAKEAVENAGLDMTKEDPFRVGVSIGSGVGSLQAAEREEKKLFGKRTGPCRTDARADDDFEYGGGKCVHCFLDVKANVLTL